MVFRIKVCFPTKVSCYTDIQKEATELACDDVGHFTCDDICNFSAVTSSHCSVEEIHIEYVSCFCSELGHYLIIQERGEIQVRESIFYHYCDSSYVWH